MKSRTRTALGIGGLTVLIAAIGAGIFVAGNTTLGVYVVVGGVPLVLVGSAAAYVRSVVGGEGNTGQYVEQRAKQVGDSLRAVWRSLDAISEQYPGFDATQLRSRADSLASDYEAQGCEFDRESGSFTVGRNASSAELQELERIDGELTTLAADRDDALYEYVRDELDSLESSLAALADTGLVSRTPSPRQPPTPADGAPSGVEYRDAVGEPFTEYRDEADGTVADAIESVREIRRSATGPIDEDAVESRLQAAAEHRRSGEYTTAVDEVLEARSELESELSGSFDRTREEMLSLASTILASDADRFVSVDPFDQVRTVERELEGLDSALDVDALTNHQRSMRSATRDIVAALESQLAESVRTLESESLPAGYYARPDAADENYVAMVDDAAEIADLESAYRRAMADLLESVQTLDRKATVVEAYPDVAETIDDRLRQEGTVGAADLPVRHAEQFFGLYFRRNPEVEFDPDAPALHRGDVETYALNVTVSYDDGSESKRRAVVSLSSDGFDERRTIETHLAASVSFAEVPFGEHELRVEPNEDDYAPVTRTVHVDADAAVDVDLESLSLYDQLVGDSEAKIRRQVSEFAPRLADRFEDVGYLSTEMEFPIKDDFVPGLLAAWADREGYAISRADGTVYVYDDVQSSQEIMNVIQYNIDDGETISHERIRSNFLSTPLPDEVISKLALDSGMPVEETGDGLRKTSGGER